MLSLKAMMTAVRPFTTSRRNREDRIMDWKEIYALELAALEERLLNWVGADTWPPVHEALNSPPNATTGNFAKENRSLT